MINITIKILIPLSIPSGNTFIGRKWYSKHQNKKLWANAFLPHKKDLKGHIFNVIEITSYRHRMLDYDNLVAGCKSCIVDNIKGFGWIIDDSPKYVVVVYKQKKIPMRELEYTSINFIKEEK